MRATALADVLDTLVTFATAALPDVHVIDGFVMSYEDAAQLAVGVSDPQDEDGQPAVTTDQTDMGAGQAQEFLTVPCSLLAPVSGESLKECRDFLAAHLALLKAAILADPTMGGLVDDSRMGTQYELNQWDASSGFAARVRFVISVDVYLS